MILVTALRGTALAAACLLALPAAARAGPRLPVVAAEDVWGSIAAQLGGSHVRVTSIVASPAADPHDYEPTAADARAIADAALVIENGVGYDPWVARLVAANGGGNVLDVGAVVGAKAGANPHRWYAPADVERVVAAITRAFERLDPRDAPSFAARRARFERDGLARYHELIAAIRRRYRGVPVGASESVFAPLAQALGLALVTPASFLAAVSEGAEPTAGDIAAVDRQVADRRIEVWVVDAQNSTPDVARITAAARARGIPVVTITETLVPPTASFQAWQVSQLEALESALARAARR